MYTKTVIADLSEDVLGYWEGLLTQDKEYLVKVRDDIGNSYDVTLDNGHHCTFIPSTYFKDKPELVVPQGWTFRVVDNGKANIEKLIKDSRYPAGNINLDNPEECVWVSKLGVWLSVSRFEDLARENSDYPIKLVSDVEGFELAEPLPTEDVIDSEDSLVNEIMEVLKKCITPTLEEPKEDAEEFLEEPILGVDEVVREDLHPAITHTVRIGDKEETYSYATREDYIWHQKYLKELEE